MPDKSLLHYVQPTGDLPGLVDSKQGRALLVIGSAASVWQELRDFDRTGFDLMGINDMMMHFPGRLDYGATLHPEKLPGWGFFQAYEASRKPHHPMETMSIRQCQGGWVKHIWPIHRSGGTSGLFGVILGLLMGYDLIVCAGIPCDESPRFFDPPWQTHDQFVKEVVYQEWVRANDAIFEGMVKSLGGRTRHLLGGP